MKLLNKISTIINKDINRILIKTNFGSDYGFGHLQRCLTFVDTLKKESKNELEIIWFLNKKSELIEEKSIIFKDNEFNEEDVRNISNYSPDLVIIDSYIPKEDYLIKLHENNKVLFFDDYNRLENYNVDIVLNGNIYANDLQYNKMDNVTFLLGMEYLFLNKEYNYIENIKAIKNSILVTTGSTDQENFILELGLYLKDLNKFDITFVIGAYFHNKENIIEKLKSMNSNYGIIVEPKSLMNYIQKSEIVLTTSGLTTYEVLKCKRKLVCFQTADNQRLIGKSVENNRLGINLGFFNFISKEKITTTFLGLK